MGLMKMAVEMRMYILFITAPFNEAFTCKIRVDMMTWLTVAIKVADKSF